MGNRRGVFDGEDLKSDGRKGADRGFAAGAGALDFDVDLAEALIEGGFASRTRGELRRERGGFLRAFVAKAASGLSGNDVALRVGDGDDGVVEGGVDVGDAAGEGALDLLLAGSRGFLSVCHDLFSSLPGGLFLVGDGLPLTFAGTGVGAGALATDRKATAMTDATIAADFGEAFDVERDFAAEVALGVVFRDFVTDRGQLGVGQILDADVFVDFDGGEDLFGGRGTDTVDVGKGDDDALLIGDINPDNTCHIGLRFLSFAQPWRCLCLGLEQMTMTLPWRRITLHLSQIGLTEGLTFINLLLVFWMISSGNGT